MLLFGRALKSVGMQVTPARLAQAGDALQLVDLTRPEDVRLALRAALTVSVDEWRHFDRLFDVFWLRRYLPQTGTDDVAPAPTSRETALQAATRHSSLVLGLVEHGPRGEGAEATYSARDVLTRRDFADYTDADVLAARRFIRQVAPLLAARKSRRMQPGPRGEVDLRRSLRRASRSGEVIELARRRRRRARLDLAALCDVSGSMDVYSNFLVQLLYALQQEQRTVHTFVFSTRLFEVTDLLRRKSLQKALEAIAVAVDTWSAGTRIGACLREFNRLYARRLVGPRTVVLVMSDGWEREDAELLGREIAALHRRAFRVIWLNPLRGRKGYEPLAKGMAAALPHTDHFLAAHNLESLVKAGRMLGKLSRG